MYTQNDIDSLRNSKSEEDFQKFIRMNRELDEGKADIAKGEEGGKLFVFN